MKTFSKTCVAAALLLASFAQAEARQWTLGDCVNYALANNISLKKTKVQQLTFENKAFYDQLEMGKVQERWVKTTDGKEMQYWVILPPHFDENKKSI